MTLAPPAPVVPPTPAPPRRPGAQAVAVVMIVAGALVALGAVVATAFSTAAALSVVTSERTADVAGVTHLRLDVAAADLTVSFSDVAEAQLQVTGAHGASRWTLDRQGTDLVVESGDHDFGLPFDQGETATLQLPESLAGIDADLTMGAGDLALDGTFDALALDLGAGDARIRGGAATLGLRLDAGDADLDLSGVETARFTVSAGDLTADLGGPQPRSVTVAATAADVSLTVAPGAYVLTGDATDADLVDTDLFSTAGASSTIDAQVSASDVSIAAAR